MVNLKRNKKVIIISVLLFASILTAFLFTLLISQNLAPARYTGNLVFIKRNIENGIIKHNEIVKYSFANKSYETLYKSDNIYTNLSLSSDGFKVLFCTVDKQEKPYEFDLREIDIKSHNCRVIYSFNMEKEYQGSVSYIPSKNMVSYSENNTVYAVDLTTKNVTTLATDKSYGGENISWNYNGAKMVYRNHEGYVAIYDTVTKSISQLAKGNNPIFSPQDNNILFENNNVLNVYNIDNRKTTKYKQRVTEMCFSPDGNYILTGNTFWYLADNVTENKVINLKTGRTTTIFNWFFDKGKTDFVWAN